METWRRICLWNMHEICMNLHIGRRWWNWYWPVRFLYFLSPFLLLLVSFDFYFQKSDRCLLIHCDQDPSSPPLHPPPLHPSPPLRPHWTEWIVNDDYEININVSVLDYCREESEIERKEWSSIRRRIIARYELTHHRADWPRCWCCCHGDGISHCNVLVRLVRIGRLLVLLVVVLVVLGGGGRCGVGRRVVARRPAAPAARAAPPHQWSGRRRRCRRCRHHQRGNAPRCPPRPLRRVRQLGPPTREDRLRFPRYE